MLQKVQQEGTPPQTLTQRTYTKILNLRNKGQGAMKEELAKERRKKNESLSVDMC